MRVLQFLAVILTALALLPGGAHLFELPNKTGLSQERYFVVQSIYRGWAFFGIAIFAAIAANLTEWQDPPAGSGSLGRQYLGEPWSLDDGTRL